MPQDNEIICCICGGDIPFYLENKENIYYCRYCVIKTPVPSLKEFEKLQRKTAKRIYRERNPWLLWDITINLFAIIIAACLFVALYLMIGS